MKFINTHFFISVLLIIFLLSCSSNSYDKNRKLKQHNGKLNSGDMELFVHEDMINGFLESMGDISQMNTDGVIHYLMIIKNPYINVFQDSAKFLSDIDIFLGEDIEENFIENIEKKVTDCERRRIFQYLEQWLNKKDTERALTMNEK